MGYKLAGFDVLGGVEIDPDMGALYERNHKPKHGVFLQGVGEFNKRPESDLPEGIRGVDILDGSPPCSSFSMAGARERKWGSNEKFREGQAVQVLDDLFFEFLDTVEKLNPKVVVAENVKGMLVGNAKGYVSAIMARFEQLGYRTQLFLLNASRMGCPQRRQRVFFIASRADLGFGDLELNFNEDEVTVEEAWKDILDERGKDVSKSSMVKYWRMTPPGKAMSKVHEKGSLFGQLKLHPKLPALTMTTKEYQLWDWRSPNLISRGQVVRLQTFPDDYDFMDQDPKYVCGMSVPPFMMQRVADQIRRQWFEIE